MILCGQSIHLSRLQLLECSVRPFPKPPRNHLFIMKKFNSILAVALICFVGSATEAAVTVGHVQNVGAGQILSSTGGAVTSGGVSIGIFASAPLDSAFGSTITSWAGLLAAGYQDVRSLSGGTLSGGFDWDFSAIGGSVSGISISALPASTQLYVFAFNAGSFINNASGFSGATEWAVIKDATNLSPADLGTRNGVLTTAVGSEILIGTDSGVNVRMAAIPEPSRLGLLGLGLAGFSLRRRRSAKA